MKIRRSHLIHHVTIATVLLLLATDVFGGVLRYVLSSYDASILAYVPKLIATVVIALVTFAHAARRRMSGFYVATLSVVLTFAVIGYLQLGDGLQVLFGLWVLIPLIFGVVAYPYVNQALMRLRGVFFLLWAAAVAGVIINSFVAFPWIGHLYQLGDFTLEAGRNWSTFGVQRLAGFSQASYAAAHQILLLSLIIAATLRGWTVRLASLTLSAAAIYLTTIKSDIAALAFIALFLLFKPVIPRVVWGLVPAVIAAAVVSIPLSSLVVNYSLELEGPLTTALLASFETRLLDTWPSAFAMIQSEGNLLLGTGIGGIGTPQALFGSGLYSPGDNLFVYLYGLFGVFAICFIAWLAYSSYKLQLKRDARDLFFFTTLVALLLLGITSNVLESAFLSFFFGLGARHIAAANHASDKRSVPREAHAGARPATS